MSLPFASSGAIPVSADEYAGFDGEPLGAWESDMEEGLEARSSWLDSALLAGAWLAVFVSTLIPTGQGALIVFSIFAGLAILRRTENGLLILVMLFFVPVGGMTFWPMVKILFPIIVFRMIFDNRFQRIFRQAFHRVSFLGAAFTLVALLSIVISPDKDLAIAKSTEYLKSLMFLVFVLGLSDRFETSVVFLKVMAVFAGVALIIGLTQYLYRDSVWLTRIAMLQETYILGGTHYQGNIYQILSDVNRARLMPVTSEPNYWGAGLIFPFGVAVGLVGASRTSLRRFFWFAVCGAILISIFGSFSRSSFLACLIVGFVLFVRMRMRSLLPAILLGAVGLILAGSWSILSERILGIGENIATTGGSGRFALWAASLKYWITSPIWGHGMGSVAHKLDSVSHSSYLEVLADLGAIGLVLYVGILLVALRTLVVSANLARALGNKRMRWLLEGCLAGLVGMMANIGAVSVGDTKFVWLAVALSICVGAEYRNRAYQEHRPIYVPASGALETI